MNHKGQVNILARDTETASTGDKTVNSVLKGTLEFIRRLQQARGITIQMKVKKENTLVDFNLAGFSKAINKQCWHK